MSIEIDAPPHTTGYLLLFRKNDWHAGHSESEIRQTLEKVKAWFDGLAAAGQLASAQPLTDEVVVVSGKGGRTVTDGPFSEAKEVIGGYVLLSVDSMEEAVAIAKSNPLNDHGLTTEVRVTSSSCVHTHRILSRLAATAA